MRWFASRNGDDLKTQRLRLVTITPALLAADKAGIGSLATAVRA